MALKLEDLRLYERVNLQCQNNLIVYKDAWSGVFECVP